MKRGSFFAASLAAFFLTVIPVGAQELGDPEEGESVFRKCKACHQVGPEASNRVGPVLNGILCRPMASAEDYSYSDALLDKASDRSVWTIAALNAYLENPGDFIGGRSRMTLKLRKEEDRLDVIAFLSRIKADGSALADGEEPADCGEQG